MRLYFTSNFVVFVGVGTKILFASSRRVP